ncbi:MAG: hypothetical protein H8D78_15725, partial [Chloroflexi bacterium]|nr:hypothetical protein [Chloroflexota bacterium]
MLIKAIVLATSLIVGQALSLSVLSVTSSAEELVLSSAPALTTNTSTSAGSSPWTPPAPLYRITIERDGLYALDYNTLDAAGLPVNSINPQTFRLFWMGQEVPLRELGDGDASFEPGEGLLFYGQAVDSLFRDGVLPTNKYTGNNTFFLTYGGANGLRMAEKDGSPGGGPPAASFLQTTHEEQNREYKAQYPPEHDADHWVWWWIEPPSRSYRDFTFTASNVASGSFTGKLTVAMLGFYDGFHHLNLYVNGNQVLNGRPRWGGYEAFETTADVPQAFFREGTNTIRVELSSLGRNVRTVAFSPNFATDRTLFAGTLGGIFRSTDGGANWGYTNTGLSNLDIRALAVSPNFANDQTLFAGTWDGVFRSTNRGGNWSAVNTGLSNRDVRTLAVSPNFAAD